jgi:hypothetical protein
MRPYNKQLKRNNRLNPDAAGAGSSSIKPLPKALVLELNKRLAKSGWHPATGGHEIINEALVKARLTMRFIESTQADLFDELKIVHVFLGGLCSYSSHT